MCYCQMPAIPAESRLNKQIRINLRRGGRKEARLAQPNGLRGRSAASFDRADEQAVRPVTKDYASPIRRKDLGIASRERQRPKLPAVENIIKSTGKGGEDASVSAKLRRRMVA